MAARTRPRSTVVNVLACPRWPRCGAVATPLWTRVGATAAAWRSDSSVGPRPPAFRRFSPLNPPDGRCGLDTCHLASARPRYRLIHSRRCLGGSASIDPLCATTALPKRHGLFVARRPSRPPRVFFITTCPPYTLTHSVPFLPSCVLSSIRMGLPWALHPTHETVYPFRP